MYVSNSPKPPWARRCATTHPEIAPFACVVSGIATTIRIRLLPCSSRDLNGTTVRHAWRVTSAETLSEAAKNEVLFSFRNNFTHINCFCLPWQNVGKGLWLPRWHRSHVLFFQIRVATQPGFLQYYLPNLGVLSLTHTHCRTIRVVCFRNTGNTHLHIGAIQKFPWEERTTGLAVLCWVEGYYSVHHGGRKCWAYHSTQHHFCQAV